MSMKSLKRIALAAIFALATVSAVGSGPECSASNDCGDTCFAFAEPGGSVMCIGGSMMVQCCAWNADGSLSFCISSDCPIPPCI